MARSPGGEVRKPIEFGLETFGSSIAGVIKFDSHLFEDYWKDLFIRSTTGFAPSIGAFRWTETLWMGLSEIRCQVPRFASQSRTTGSGRFYAA